MQWTAKLITHKGEQRIGVYFEKDADLIARIKKLEEATWSQSKRVWHLPDSAENRERFKIEQASSTLPQEKANRLAQFKQWMKSKRYSDSTIKTYTDALRSFFLFYADKEVADITNNDIIIYNNDFILEHKLSASYQNQIVNAIKLYFQTIEHTKISVDLVHRPKRPKLLPNVLSKEEVKAILNALGNIKHRAMLS